VALVLRQRYGNFVRQHGMRLILLVILASFLAGCQHLGGDSMPRDRRDYGQAINTSWKEQMLGNIVRHRYLDTPVYLDISSVVSTYSYQSQASLGATLFPGGNESGSRTLGISGQLTESPTVSYTPLAGEKLANSLLRPIPPETIFAMFISGRRADFLLRATVISINGVGNVAATGPPRTAAAGRFSRIVEALDRINAGGGVGVSIENASEGKNVAYITLDDGGNEEIAAQIRQLRELLQLDPGASEYRLVFGVKRQPNQIALLTRSMQQMIGELAAGIDVPEIDLREGRATAPHVGAFDVDPPLMHIASGDVAPEDAYVKVRYRDRWFWVDDRDIASKRMFVFMLLFWSMASTGTQPHVPVLTLPLR
jgi:hypothetical protein